MFASTRILIVSLLISLLGHLIIFTTFLVTTPGEGERPPELASVSFLGELVERRAPSRVKVVAREGRSELQPLVRGVEAGPDLILSKPRPMAPAPQIPLKEIFSLPERKEALLLRVGIAGDKKEKPPEFHLLEKE